MRKLYYLIFLLLAVGTVSAQEKLSKEEQARRQKNIDAANPFKQFGYKAKVATLSKGKYLEVHDLDSIVTIGSIRFHVDKKEIVGNAAPDTINGIYARPTGDMPSRWLSPDPLSEEFTNWSPYSFVFNNPLRFNDPTGMAPDEVIITGTQSQAALQELQNSVQGQLTLSMNSAGKVSYTQTGTGPLTAGAAQLVNAVDSQSITVNVVAENTKTTSTGNLYIGGAFMGNTVTAGDPLLGGGNTVSTQQEINPGVLSSADNYFGTSGSLTLHEVTESYQGALITQASGTSVGPATNADAANPSSVYMRAHNAATPQNMAVNQNVYDAQGNQLQSPFTGATRVDYTVQQGTRAPQTIMTYP